MSTPTPTAADLAEARRRAQAAEIIPYLDQVIREREQAEEAQKIRRQQEEAERIRIEQAARQAAQALLPTLQDLERQAQGILNELAGLLGQFGKLSQAYGATHNEIRAHLAIFRGNSIVEQAALGLGNHDSLTLLRVAPNADPAHQLARQVLAQVIDRHGLS